MPYHGIPGKARALHAILSSARDLNARACLVFDGSVRTMTADWVAALARPIVDGEFDFVTPVYVRHPFGGALTKGVVSPLIRALYGLRLRQPAAAEFACTGQLVDHFLHEDLWDRSGSQSGIDIWLATAAASGDRYVTTPAFDARGWAYGLAFAPWSAAHRGPQLLVGDDVPAQHYRPSRRRVPPRPPTLEYPGHMEIRRVSSCGTIRWQDRPVYLTTVLAGEDVALEEIADGIWLVQFGGVRLVRIDERTHAWARYTHTAGSTRFFNTMTLIGTPVGIGVIILIISALLLAKRHWWWTAYLIFTTAAGGLIDLQLKSFFARSRPDLAEALRQASGYSFPSGHAMGSVVCFGALSYLAMRAIPRWRWRADGARMRWSM